MDTNVELVIHRLDSIDESLNELKEMFKSRASKDDLVRLEAEVEKLSTDYGELENCHIQFKTEVKTSLKTLKYVCAFLVGLSTIVGALHFLV